MTDWNVHEYTAKANFLGMCEVYFQLLVINTQACAVTTNDCMHLQNMYKLVQHASVSILNLDLSNITWGSTES